MSKIYVSGLVNMETTLSVEDFPIEYVPGRFPFFGVKSRISGVGYNVAKALTTLGDEVNIVSLVGKDFIGDMIGEVFIKDGVNSKYLLREIEETAQSVILYDKTGRRQLNTDLKDLQEREIPEHIFEEAAKECDIAILCNINFSRKYLKIAKARGKIIASDVHTIANLEDEYNGDFMSASDILFMSHESLPCTPEEWAKKVINRYGNKIVVIGMGSEGSLLCVKEDNFMERIPAFYTRPVVNTVGAGDSFFSSFIHFYNKDKNPYEAIKKASVFASYKIGEKTSSEGFLTEEQLETLYKNTTK